MIVRKRRLSWEKMRQSSGLLVWQVLQKLREICGRRLHHRWDLEVEALKMVWPMPESWKPAFSGYYVAGRR